MKTAPICTADADTQLARPPRRRGPYVRSRAISARQYEANRRNALRSTGPRSAEGKTRSSRNSIKHGAWVQPTMTSEQQERYLAHLQRVVSEFGPASELEESLIREFADVQWQIMLRTEAELSAARELIPDGGNASATFALAWTNAELRLSGRMTRLLREILKARENRQSVENVFSAKRTDFESQPIEWPGHGALPIANVDRCEQIAIASPPPEVFSAERTELESQSMEGHEAELRAEAESPVSGVMGSGTP